MAPRATQSTGVVPSASATAAGAPASARSTPGASVQAGGRARVVARRRSAEQREPPRAPAAAATMRRIAAIVASAACAAARTTARSCASRSPRSARWPPSRCTCSSTPRSSGTSGRRSSRRSRSPRPSSRARQPVQLPRPTGPPRRSRGCTAPARTSAPAQLAAQALWLALGDRRWRSRSSASRSPARSSTLLGGERRRPPSSPRATCASARAGLPFALIALAGQGFLRGVGDLRTPLVIVVAAQRRRTSSSRWCSSTASTGAWTARRSAPSIAQLGMGVAFVVAAAARRRPGGRRGRRRLHRAAARASAASSSCAPASLLRRVHSRPARCSRAWARRRSAPHQIAFQLFVFLALVLDAIAIAGAGASSAACSGAGDADGRRRGGAAHDRLVAGVRRRRAAGCSLLAARLLPRVHRRPAVIERAEALWPLFALMQPPGAVVFALDGILIGAGDTRYLALVDGRRRAGDLRPDRAARARAGLGDRRRVGRRCSRSWSSAWSRSASRFRGRRWAVVGARPRAGRAPGRRPRIPASIASIALSITLTRA